MRLVKDIFLFGLISIIAQTVEQIALFKLTSFEYLQETRHWYVIATMFGMLIYMYFIFRRRNNKSRPNFANLLIAMFFVQVLTIIWLIVVTFASVFFAAKSKPVPHFIPITIEYNSVNLIVQFLILSLGLPLIVLSIIYLLDNKRQPERS